MISSAGGLRSQAHPLRFSAAMANTNHPDSSNVRLFSIRLILKVELFTGLHSVF